MNIKNGIKNLLYKIVVVKRVPCFPPHSPLGVVYL